MFIIGALGLSVYHLMMLEIKTAIKWVTPSHFSSSKQQMNRNGEITKLVLNDDELNDVRHDMCLCLGKYVDVMPCKNCTLFALASSAR